MPIGCDPGSGRRRFRSSLHAIYARGHIFRRGALQAVLHRTPSCCGQWFPLGGYFVSSTGTLDSWLKMRPASHTMKGINSLTQLLYSISPFVQYPSSEIEPSSRAEPSLQSGTSIVVWLSEVDIDETCSFLRKLGILLELGSAERCLSSSVVWRNASRRM